MPDAILSATDLHLSFGKGALLEGASLSINEGERLGLVGRNGCGKSSFLRLLAGEEEPDSGLLSFRQGTKVGYLSQEFHLDEERTVAENIRAGAADIVAALEKFQRSEELSENQQDEIQTFLDQKDGWNLDARVESLSRQLGTPPLDTLIGPLSGGEKRRVGMAKALIAQPDLLILDEPTNHLDTQAIEWLESYLSTYPGACLFVTHDRYFLDRLATRIAELDGGQFYSHEGNYSDFLISKEARYSAAQAAEGKRQRFLKREIEWVRAGVKARGTKQRNRLDNFYAVKAEKSPDEEINMEVIIPPAPDLGNVIVEAEGVSQFIGDRPLFYGLDLTFRRGECIGVVGPNGVGKTTLLRILLGELKPTDGSVRIGQKTIFNYADQSRLTLDESNSIFEEVAEGKEMMKFGAETISVRGYLKRFLFSDDRVNEQIANLSGGERNRVLLAKILKQGGNFLVLDEPTNDLDLPSLRALEEALIHFTGTSIVVSHDRYFLDRVCDRLIVFDGTQELKIHDGNYSYYQEKKHSRSAASKTAFTAEDISGKKKAGGSRKADAPPKLKWAEERELETMEETILERETEVEELQCKVNDPQFFVDHPDDIESTLGALKTKEAEVKDLYERWEHLTQTKQAWEEWKKENG